MVGEYLRMDTKRQHVFQKIGLLAQNMITILGSIVTIFEGPIGPFNEHENLHLKMNKITI